MNILKSLISTTTSDSGSKPISNNLITDIKLKLKGKLFSSKKKRGKTINLQKPNLSKLLTYEETTLQVIL